MCSVTATSFSSNSLHSGSSSECAGETPPGGTSACRYTARTPPSTNHAEVSIISFTSALVGTMPTIRTRPSATPTFSMTHSL